MCIFLIIAGTEARASDSQRRNNGCMNKRMTADRAISYNDAKRACLEELKALNARLNPGNLKSEARSSGGGEASSN
jgi:hypothetical protein